VDRRISFGTDKLAFFAKNIFMGTVLVYFMRRLILQFSVDEFLKRENLDLSQLKKVKSLEFLQILEHDPDGVEAIIRIDTEEELSDIEDYIKLMSGNILKTELLEREKDGAYILFIKYKVTSTLFRRAFTKTGVYSVFCNIQKGRLKVALLGSAKQLRYALESLEKSKIHFKMVSLTDARFASDSPLKALTEKQRRVITTAYELGYYDLPRKIDSEGLAKKLNIARSTLVVHRRKAEKHILTEIIDGESAD
jgi:predicted DNA binding protein